MLARRDRDDRGECRRGPGAGSHPVNRAKVRPLRVIWKRRVDLAGLVPAV
jgi:hypothetical protein